MEVPYERIIELLLAPLFVGFIVAYFSYRLNNHK